MEQDKETKLEQKVKRQSMLLKEKDRQLQKSERDKEYYKKLIDNYSEMGTKNFNTVTYILNSYPNAPHLKTIEPKKIQHFKESESDNNNDKTKTKDIISHYRNNRLVDHVVEAIVLLYKKDNPSEQSVWATDSSRHNFIIKELLEDNDSYWVAYDKKGIKSEKYLLDPILSLIRERVVNYLRDSSDLLMDDSLSVFQRDSIVDLQKYGSLLIKSIDDNILNKEIIKKLAKHIHHEKSNIPLIEEVD